MSFPLHFYIGFVIVFPGSLFRDTGTDGFALPLLTQTTSLAFVRARSQVLEWFVACSVSERTRYRGFEVICGPAVYGRESWCLEHVEKIRRRDSGVYKKRAFLVEG